MIQQIPERDWGSHHKNADDTNAMAKDRTN